MEAPPYKVIDALYPGADKDMGNPHILSMYLTTNKEWVCTVANFSNCYNEYDLLILDMKYNTIANVPIYGNHVYKTVVCYNTRSNATEVLIIHSDQNDQFLMVSKYSTNVYKLEKICGLGYMSEFDTNDKEFIQISKSKILIKSKCAYICICNCGYFFIYLGLDRDHALEMYNR